ncbi:non-receptor serine/threonine protein kinase [Lithospermum erythrorhizon]|uniref:Non-receptor serine/threonine protein kinase n=1 Tax=Lithospermum erythrorhizon TaxID=34254 RepID=A0AAV3NUQ7_LITER
MTTIDISREIQEIAFKLSATKPKQREEGILLLNTLLSGQHSIAFCRYISKQTADLNHNQLPHSETWPFLIKLLIQCVKLEVSGSKKRLPKSDYAKTLKLVIQRANDSQFTGHDMLLLPVAKLVFNHIWEVLKDVPSFQSDYGSILRHLLRAQTYRFHMRNRIYCCLVRLYLEKVKTSATSTGQLKPTDDVIWFIRTLQLLFENPPEDYSDDLREDVVKGFAGIFSYVR